MNGLDPFKPQPANPQPDYVMRMMTEVKELGERLVSLTNFIGNVSEFGKLNHGEQRALISQFDAMEQYHRVLSSRYLLELGKQR